MPKRYFTSEEVELLYLNGEPESLFLSDVNGSVVDYSLIVSVDGFFYPLLVSQDLADDSYIYDNQLSDSVELKKRTVVQEYWVDEAGVEYR